MDAVQVEAIRIIMTAPEVTSAQAAAGSSAVADPTAVARFQELMKEPVAIDRVDAAKIPELQIPFAERLEASFSAQQVTYQNHVDTINNIIQGAQKGVLSQTELMKLQYEMQSMTFQQNLVSRVIESASSAIQTLIKNQ